MKRLICCVLLSAGVAGSAHAAPFLTLGDSAELFFTGDIGLRLDDNIFLDSQNEESDVVYTMAPGLELQYGKGSLMSGMLGYREEFLRYSDNDAQDSELSNAFLSTTFEGAKINLTLNANFNEFAQNSPDIQAVGTLVRRDVTSLNATGELALSMKTSLGAGVDYNNTDFQTAGYVDYESLTVPLDVYYQWSPKLDLSVGYRYRDNQVALAGNDSQDHYLNVGARGEFTPKLSGQLRIGYGLRDFDAGDEEGQIGLDAAFTYEASAKTNYRLGIRNDFANSATGTSQENLSANFGGTYAFTAFWSGSFDLVYNQTQYLSAGGREDDYFEGQIGVNYTPSAYMTVTAGYVRRDNSSSVAGADFSNNVFGLSASFRY